MISRSRYHSMVAIPRQIEAALGEGLSRDSESVPFILKKLASKGLQQARAGFLILFELLPGLQWVLKCQMMRGWRGCCAASIWSCGVRGVFRGQIRCHASSKTPTESSPTRPSASFRRFLAVLAETGTQVRYKLPDAGVEGIALSSYVLFIAISRDFGFCLFRSRGILPA